MKPINQRGFSHPLVLLLLIIVLAVVGFTGWRVWDNLEDEDSSEAPTLQATATPCEGRLYDSHAHPDDDEVLERLPAIMTKHNIGCSVLFDHVDITDIDESLEMNRERYEGMPGRIALFYDVIKDDPSEVTRERLEELYQKSGGKFNGFGEYAFYQDPLRGTLLTAEPWPTIFAFAAEKKLPVMIHPMPELVASLEVMLDRYPDTKVIVHGFELPDQMGDLLKSYPNLYYTLDTATMLTLDGDLPQVLMYPGGGPGSGFDVNEFLSIYKAEREQILAKTIKNWLPVLLAAPERVMWGTDISMEGHVDDRVYDILISLTDEFLNEVPQQYQQGYLRDNAFKLLGPGVTF